MQELRLVAVSEDGTYLVLATAGRGTRFTLPVDDRLRAAVRGNFSRLGQYEIEVESPLRPKEIQARIRAGESAEEIAATAGIPVERVRWFEGPVLQEREYMAQQAQRVIVRLPGETSPGPTLGELVTERLTRRGVPADEIDWDSCKRDDNLWRVRLGFVWNGHTRHAEWLFDPRRRHITPNDDEAMRLSSADHVEAAAKEKAEDDIDTIRPFVPRFAPKLAPVPSLPPDAPGTARPESVRHEPRVEPPAAFRPDLTPVPFRLPDPLAGLDAATLEDRDAREWHARVQDPHARRETTDRGSAVIDLPTVAQAGHDEPGLGPRPPDAHDGATDDATAPEGSESGPPAAAVEPPGPAESTTTEATGDTAGPARETPAPAEPATAESMPEAASAPADGEPASADSSSDGGPAKKTAAATAPGQDKTTTGRPVPAPAPKPAAATPIGPPPRPKPRPRQTVPARPAASAAAAGTPGTPQRKEPANDAKTELPAPPVPKPRPRKSRRRASVPSWDEIMFGARKPD